MSSLEALARDLDDLVFTKPDDRERIQALASSVLSALDDAKAEALEVGDNATDDDDGGGDVDRTFAAVRDGVPGLVETAVVTKVQILRQESSRIAQWSQLRHRLRRIRACAVDRTQGKQVRRYVEWCLLLLEAFRAASDSFPPEREGAGLTERRERGVFRDEVLPSYIPDWNDTPYGRALAEVAEPGLRGLALPKLELLQKALEAAAQAMIHVAQGEFWDSDEAQELSKAVMDCYPLTAARGARGTSSRRPPDPLDETEDQVKSWLEQQKDNRHTRQHVIRLAAKLMLSAMSAPPNSAVPITDHYDSVGRMVTSLKGALPQAAGWFILKRTTNEKSLTYVRGRRHVGV